MDAAENDFRAATERLLRREALRRAAQDIDKMAGPGLEAALARISAEVTAEAWYARRRSNQKEHANEHGCT